jgi:hypothetical protein
MQNVVVFGLIIHKIQTFEFVLHFQLNTWLKGEKKNDRL